MSLSIVFGTPMTDSSTPSRRAVEAIFSAPRSEPSPPITNRTEIPSLTSVSTISAGSWSPREVPRMVPPLLWMSETTSRDRRTGVASGPTSPRKPSRNPTTSATP